MYYNTKKIDVNFWISEILQGIEFRKRYAKEARWEDWRAYYRGDWASGILPVNYFFMLLRALVPRVYLRNPGVSVSPGKPGLPNAIFAQILGRVDNKLLRHMKMKKPIKMMIQDTFLFGTSVGKLGFGGQFSPSPKGGESAPPLINRVGRIEYKLGLEKNMPWFMRVHPKDFVVPYNTTDADDCMWKGHRVVRPFADVKYDPRYKNTGDLKPTKVVEIPSGGRVMRKTVGIDVVELYEIRDKKYQRALVVSNDHAKVLLEVDDYLQTEYGGPFFTATFNPDDEVFWGIPDAAVVEPQQLEMNEIRTQTMRHRRVALVKILYEAGAIDKEQLQLMTSEDVAAGVEVKSLSGVTPMQISNIPPDLIQAGEVVRSDIREEVGFSRNQMGETTPASSRTTATEASIVQMASEIRVDERKDIMGDLVADVVRSVNELLFQFWTGEQVIDLVGPYGLPVWVQFSPEMLKGGAYEVQVDPDSSTPMSRSMRQNKASELFRLLQNDPYVNPIELRKYLLREWYGVDYDSLMQGLPPGLGAVNPMNINQYGMMMQNAAKQGGKELMQLPQGGPRPEGGQ